MRESTRLLRLIFLAPLKVGSKQSELMDQLQGKVDMQMIDRQVWFA